MAFVLGPGLLTNPDFYSRIEYIKTHKQLWQLGWSVWIFTALTFLVFTFCMWRHHLKLGISDLNRKILITALAFAALGALLDLHSEWRQIFYVTEIAARYGKEAVRKDFIVSQFGFMFESAFLASLMYSFATLCLVFATRESYPKWLFKLGSALYIVSFLATGVSFLATYCNDHHVNPMKDILVATNAILFPLLVLWQLGIAYKSKGESNA